MARAPQLKKPDNPEGPGRQGKRRRVVGGVDTHADTHHAAVLLLNGARLADAQFPATAAGHAQLLQWLRSFGRLHAVGVEGTGSYGAGLSRHLHAAGVRVIEVNRPDRRQRRLLGKSDPLDAYAAADAVVSQRATAIPKLGTGMVESIRALHTTRAGAVKARTATINQLTAQLITAPTPLRDRFHGLTGTALIQACARLRPTGDMADPDTAVRFTLRSLARRHRALHDEITELDTQLKTLVERACPQLITLHGVGTETAAQLLTTAGDNPTRLTSEGSFAALCGAAPIPASSGRTDRHRLSRGGDRQANRALYRIALTRMATCPRTRTYVTRRTTEGLSKKTSSAASNATSPARSSTPSPAQTPQQRS
jgi:transposase